MTDYTQIPELVFPNGSFTKAYDQVIITGEIYRAAYTPEQLRPDDKAFYASVKISTESFKTLRQPMESNRAMTGLKKVELKVKKLDSEGNPIKEDNKFVFEEDEMGDPVKAFSHLQATLKQNATINGSPVSVPVTMADTGEPVQGIIAEGSIVSVLGQCYNTVYQNKPAMGMNLKAIKVHKLVLLEGGGNDIDPWTALGVATAPAKVQEAPAAQPKTTTQSEQPDADEDFDESIPF